MSAPSKEEIAELVDAVRPWAEHPTLKMNPLKSIHYPVIVALFDDNERLRAGQQRPMPWTEDEVKALIKEAVESDPNAKCLHCGGTFPKTDLYHWRDCPKHTARIENERLRAEREKLVKYAAGLDDWNDKLRAGRAECLALLLDAPFGDDLFEQRRRALLAKLRGQS